MEVGKIEFGPSQGIVAVPAEFHFYSLEYNDIENNRETFVWHRKKFSKGEWFDLVHEAVQALKADGNDDSDWHVVKWLCEHKGFTLVEAELSAEPCCFWSFEVGDLAENREKYIRSTRTLID